ncbi:MAG TPA: hypothetical protein VG097_18265 [Gemmata sp.]|jgi:hypothetical protein|nr:hypothetical protein [Gemmata sp.]
MSQDEMVRRAWEAFKEKATLPPGEGFQRLVDKGIIDQNGEVIFVPIEKQKKRDTEETKQ